MSSDSLTEPAAENIDGRGRRRLRTREELVRTASNLFAENGFDETTMDDIARAAGVARQTVFNHFPRKEDFAFEWGARNRRMLDEMIAQSDFGARSASDQLMKIMRRMAASYEGSANEARVLLRAWVRAGGPLLEDPAPLSQHFARIIASGQASGEFSKDANALTTGRVLRAAYLDAIYQWVGSPSMKLYPELRARVLIVLGAVSAGGIPVTTRSR